MIAWDHVTDPKILEDFTCFGNDLPDGMGMIIPISQISLFIQEEVENLSLCKRITTLFFGLVSVFLYDTPAMFLI